MRRRFFPARFLRNLRQPLFLLAGLLGVGRAHGQADSLAGIGRRFLQYSQRHPAEKLFLHLDRAGYVSGETLWFSLYAVEGTTQQPLAASTVAYVEVLDAQQVPVLQTKVALRDAAGHGALLLPAELATGRYTVRAYTSWMQNFGPEFYFHAPITVVNTRTGPAPKARPATPGAEAQFFAEGGDLVQGLTSKVGVKVTDGFGRGVAAEGTVLDPAGAVVARFRTLRFGLGSFSFTPAKAGGAYRAVIRVPNQPPLTRPLPAVREQGYVLHLDAAHPDYLRLVVQAQGAALAAENVFLLGHAGQRVAVAAGQPLRAGETEFRVPRRDLAAGVSHFTLFDSHRRPVCERLFFQPPTALALRAQTDQPAYAPRAPVRLQLAAGPELARLSVAVYLLDSLADGGPNIGSYLWLQADVKGLVEHPDYYLSAAPDAAEAADNLMLTQGWSRFRWANVLAGRPDSLPHLPELGGHLVRGRVLNRATGTPVADVPTYLAVPGRRIRLYNTLSRTDGSLLFEVPDWTGPQQVVLQTDPRRDSLARVELLSPFSRQYAAASAQAPLSAERLAASLLRRHVQQQVRLQFGDDEGRTAPALVAPADTVPFYGKPNQQYYLDRYTRFKQLEEVIAEYVPGVLLHKRKDGFHFLVPDNSNGNGVMENPLVLLDGLPIFNTNRMVAFSPLKIQRLDVVMTPYVVGPITHRGIISYATYKGDLAGYPLDPQALLQEYEGVQARRDFYAPRYETPAETSSRRPDFRSLLYWNPAVLTPAAASTPLTFYTSDQPGTYRVVVQGLGSAGHAGSTSFTFEVKPGI